MKKAALLFLAVNFFYCQKKEVEYSSPPPPMETVTLNNTITSKYVNIPNTKIYVAPFEHNYKMSNGAIVSNDNNYTLTVMESGDGTIKNTINDFSKEGFEAKGIKVFDEKFITVNGVESKIIFLQGKPEIKGILLFIDNKAEKIMVTAMYEANNVLLENKVKDMLYSIVYNKEEKVDYVKNASFALDLTGTKFKFHKYTSNSYNFTEEGKDTELNDPAILVTQIPKIAHPDLKSFLGEVKASMGKYGLENIEEKNIIETKDSIQFELYGKMKGNPSVILYKIIKDPAKDFILLFMASSKQNIDQDLVQFKKIAKTFSFK
ncbi:MAG: hypothetical protein MUW56_15890 [Chryseobacterium sp.]|uniref:hypothetical protein n=1 Tax=Chryseobacterium sp. TaxID=1871047 RepID=UPI0025C2C8CF|nr:hypothetical protein [Chryseobacterium sp.]MCJ7935054.1 hypothetical protein [Chryseobacterium sp.]